MVLKVDTASFEKGNYFKCKNPEGASFYREKEVKLTLGGKYKILEHYRDDKNGSIVAYRIIDDTGMPVFVKDGHFNFYDQDSDGNETASTDVFTVLELTRRTLSSFLGFIFGCFFLGSLLGLSQVMSLISDTQTTTMTKIVNISVWVTLVVLLPTIAIFCYKRGVIPSKAIFCYKVSYSEKKRPVAYFCRQSVSSMIALPFALSIIPFTIFTGFFSLVSMVMARADEDKDILSKVVRLFKQLGMPLVKSGQKYSKTLNNYFNTKVEFCSYKETLRELKRAA